DVAACRILAQQVVDAHPRVACGRVDRVRIVRRDEWGEDRRQYEDPDVEAGDLAAGVMGDANREPPPDERGVGLRCVEGRAHRAEFPPPRRTRGSMTA